METNIMESTVCFDDVKRATIALATKDRALALGLLAQFGVSRASSLPLSQWREYCFDAQAILDHGAQPKPAQTLGDLLRKAGDRLPSKTPTLDKLEAEHAGNAAMIARDGIAKPVAIRGTPAPCPSYGQCTYPECSHFLDVSKDAAKAALSFLTYSPDLQPSSHQVGPAFGSALLRG